MLAGKVHMVRLGLYICILITSVISIYTVQDDHPEYTRLTDLKMGWGVKTDNTGQGGVNI